MEPTRKNHYLTDAALLAATAQDARNLGESLLESVQKIHHAYLTACEAAARQLVLEGCKPTRVILEGQGPLVENYADGEGWLRIRIEVRFADGMANIVTEQFKPGGFRLFKLTET